MNRTITRKKDANAWRNDVKGDKHSTTCIRLCAEAEQGEQSSSDVEETDRDSQHYF